MISNRSQQKNRLSQSQSAAYAHFTQLSPDSSDFYNQTDRGCSASRKVRDHLETRNPVKRGLTRKQVEALFRDLP
jgi:hypothetical protein